MKKHPCLPDIDRLPLSYHIFVQSAIWS